jgi:hypothetical protein
LAGLISLRISQMHRDRYEIRNFLSLYSEAGCKE